MYKHPAFSSVEYERREYIVAIYLFFFSCLKMSLTGNLSGNIKLTYL